MPLTDTSSVFTLEDDASLIYVNEFFSSLLPEGGLCPFTQCDHRDVPQINTVELLVQDISNLLKSIKPFKSPGPDDIHPRILCELCDILAVPLLIIFKKSLLTGEVPSIWKRANVTAVHKKGSRDEASNYRPISLTCICSKVMETLVNRQLVQHLLNNNILSRYQHGFTYGRSCLTNLLATLEDCSLNMDNNIPTDIIYLDFAKAFDTVPHARLCHKLYSSGIGGNLLSWLGDFLRDRKQRVCVNGAHSEWENVLSGVPQGSVIGPTLFLVFINDSSKVQIFADDSKIYRHIRSDIDMKALQDDLHAVDQWSVNWKMRLNTSKCQVLRIGTSRMQENRPIYKLSDACLKNTEEQRDLGVLVDSTLEFDKHIDKCIQKAYASWGIIRRTFERIDPILFNLLYKTYVRPHLEFCQ